MLSCLQSMLLECHLFQFDDAAGTGRVYFRPFAQIFLEVRCGMALTEKVSYGRVTRREGTGIIMLLYMKVVSGALLKFRTEHSWLLVMSGDAMLLVSD